MSEDLAPVNALNRWVAASRELDGRYKMLESLQENIQAIIAQANQIYGEADGIPKGVIIASDFAEILSSECSNLSEQDKD